MSADYDLCHTDLHINPNTSPVTSGIMFAAGVIGNVAALVILEVRRCRDARNGDRRWRSLFHILITSLVVTDLAGTCLISPLVQVSYSRNDTLVGLSPAKQHVCKYFGVTMTFFSLATMSLLFTMALERCFAIGYPYLYNRYVTKKCAYITIPLVFVLCILFCFLPFVGFGTYVQYCPGTWCFIDMNPTETGDRAYANLYATVMLVLVMSTVVCNGFVVYQLFKMYQRRRRNGRSMMGTTRSSSDRKALSMAEEVEHLILLVFMTIIFIICTLPLIRVYLNSLGAPESHRLDLIALRFISVNSIIDPWVFIILSPGVLHFFWASVCRAPMGLARGSVFKSSLAKDNSPAILELSQPTLEYNEHSLNVETR
ncbi:Prostaglandin E2 receptor EP2 subtype [Nibea albiflora]|uniref:Prostaglandin E2 receptor EP2 subtype n=1 Tax=Nibea albiflora TaxID=240163 RepID=A0ACB7ERW2_NIBAL|nr:Prostaglandin E2 receptor EP2 subtype [Nibea albiflora]